MLFSLEINNCARFAFFQGAADRQVIQPAVSPTILKPDIHAAELAFSLNGRTNLKLDSGNQIVADYSKYKEESNKDKQIRAIFVRFFAGYRSCFLITRINLKPMIPFHKAKILSISKRNQRFAFSFGKFFGHHRLVKHEFMQRVLDSMSFEKFIEERGPLFRPRDTFYDVYAIVYDQLQREHDATVKNNSTAVLQNSKKISQSTVLKSKSITTTNIYPKMPQPAQTSCVRDDVPEFSHFDRELINAAIKEGLKKQQNSRYE
ncbi:unnamed protein product [Rotaria magnacalcarata]|uniref:dDENN domain-containing protein n=2 Tax=Rotaria magnacalcarata TaxID=392030 RepID=A0A816EUI0_9BILA|nr:unnamed protein product [Rotaria magnacalcarata]CAF1650688.1 unnamed protein product [Rotaria magnacalcarata]CAF3907456.1 unnamed protein product [Rotaria magnacalcarata]CAF3958040.1 unnamed protein product [Rotaria magnacalcarata]CAF4071244.1 unnamed protein product [Rotaria magnacalcarata]